MYFEHDLSAIKCPKCYKNNDDLEVIGMHIFPYSEGDRFPYYDIKCYNCNKVFTKQVFLPNKET
jgi:hypothetical protein